MGGEMEAGGNTANIQLAERPLCEPISQQSVFECFRVFLRNHHDCGVVNKEIRTSIQYANTNYLSETNNFTSPHRDLV